MYTRLLTSFAALLLALCLLSACGASTSFNAKQIAFEPVQSVQSPAPKSKTLPFGDPTRKLSYQYDETSLSGEIWEVFRSSDGTTAKFCKGNGSVSVTAGENAVIAHAASKLTTEDDFLACIQDWVHLLAPDVDLSSYQYACRTTYPYSVKVDNGKGGYRYREVVDGFYRAQSADEEIDCYLFTYTQTVNGIAGELATENGVIVEMDSEGGLLSIHYDCYEMDWTFSITDKEIEKTVDAYVKDYGEEVARRDSVSSRASEVEILEKHLTIVNGEVQLCVTVEALFSGGWFTPSTLSTITLYLSPKPST